MISVFHVLEFQNNSLADSLENTCESGLSGPSVFRFSMFWHIEVCIGVLLHELACRRNSSSGSRHIMRASLMPASLFKRCARKRRTTLKFTW